LNKPKTNKKNQEKKSEKEKKKGGRGLKMNVFLYFFDRKNKE